MNIGYIIGPAGSGKSHMTSALHQWMNLAEFDVATLNLDPGVVRLPYSPDIDVRTYVDYEAIVDKYELGPNGGLIVAMDHVAIAMDEIHKELQDLSPEFLLVDFPGQIEVMAFRSSGIIIVDELSKGNQMAGLFLMDPVLAKSASSFVSTMLFGISIQYRLQTAMSYVISKADLLKPEDLEKISGWTENPDFIYNDLLQDTSVLNADLSRRVTELIISQEQLGEIPTISAETNENMDIALGLMERVWGSHDMYMG